MTNTDPNDKVNDSSKPSGELPVKQLRHRTYTLDLCKMVAGTIFLCLPFVLIYFVEWYVADNSWSAGLMHFAFVLYALAVVLIVVVAIEHFRSIKDAQSFDESLAADFGFGGFSCIFLLILASIVAVLLKWASLLFSNLFLLLQ